MMRRVLQTQVHQLPCVSVRAAASYMSGGGRVGKKDPSQSPSRAAGPHTSDNGMLFPDAQAHDLGEAEVNASKHYRPAVERQRRMQEMAEEEYEEEEGEMRAPPNLKRRYDSLIRPKREAVVLKSSFSNRVAAETHDDGEDDMEDDVTKIYTRDEVGMGNDNNNNNNKNKNNDNSMKMNTSTTTTSRHASRYEPNVSAHQTAAMTARSTEENIIEDDDIEDEVTKIHTSRVPSSKGPRDVNSERFDESNACNVLRTVEGGNCYNTRTVEDCDDTTAVEDIECKQDNEDDMNEEDTHQNNDEEGEFKNVRNHPFFADLLRRMEKNATRQRLQIKSSGRYNLEAVNLCVRPLLQFTDYPFTIRQLNQMAPFLYSNLLRRSLPDLKACRRLHIYRSAETDVVLDWSVEDFLRRRYESIHLSWEPVKIVMRRFNWNQEVMSDRDCLLYFSKFRDYIELAELEISAGDEKPSAIPIDDAERMAEQRPVPVSKLLIRRKPAEDTEPSITEAIRLMGIPALSKPAKSRKVQVHASEKDSVEGTFERIRREAASVDGDDTTRLQHAMDTVPSLRQATNPSGSCIKDFSLGKERSAVISGNPSSTTTTTTSSRLEAGGNPFDEGHRAYTPESYEALANAYHKKKVEASQIRRRLLSTDNIDQAGELQEKLVLVQRELPRLKDQLEKMRQQRRIEKVSSPERSHTSFFRPDTYAGEKEVMNSDTTIEKSREGYISAKSSREMQKGEYASTASSSSYTDHMKQKQRQRQEEQEEKNEDPAEDNLKVTEETHHSADVCGTTSSSGEIESLSSAAMMLRQEIQSLQERRRHEEEVLLKRMEEALGTLAKIEDTIKNVSQREAKETERKNLEMQRKKKEKEEAEKQMRREQAEARARALEEELLRKHEERMRVLNKQREEARQAQREAELALKQQREAEQAALEAEMELERKLEEAKSKIWSEKVNEEPTHNNNNNNNNNNSRVSRAEETTMTKANNVKPSTEHETSGTSTALTSTSAELTCTPDQYDGLCLGAERLRTEIAELERQMESEGDEDDMTLMAVLATSRSDLEELEDFIRVVRQREAWAAERDKVRKEEQERQARLRGDNSNDVQEQISGIRFQIDLMEKRLQHATERNIITKLEQRIINSRREINRLRLEQDRLRRSGQHADAGGICVPSSISIAKALAQEEMETTTNAEAAASDNSRCANKKVNSISGRTACHHHETEEAEDMEGNNEASQLESVDIDGNADGDDGDDYIAAEECGEAEHTADAPLDSRVATLEDGQKELKRLTGRMEGILDDIKYLEENIASREDGGDAEATAASLAELQKKLQQLLEMRDGIKRRTDQLAMEDSAPKSAPAPSPRRHAAAATMTSVKSKTTTTTAANVAPRRPKVIAPLSSRPVSSHTGRADTEVLHFEQYANESHSKQHFSHSGTAAHRKMRKVTKSKKARR